MKQIGYAAAQTSGYKTSGELSREDVAALTRSYLEYMGQALIGVGLPLNKLYHHAGGVPNIPYNASFTSAVKAGAAAGWSVGGPEWVNNPLYDPPQGWCAHSTNPEWACDQNK
jgi:hypothetical protein